MRGSPALWSPADKRGAGQSGPLGWGRFGQSPSQRLQGDLLQSCHSLVGETLAEAQGVDRRSKGQSLPWREGSAGCGLGPGGAIQLVRKWREAEGERHTAQVCRWHQIILGDENKSRTRRSPKELPLAGGGATAKTNKAPQPWPWTPGEKRWGRNRESYPNVVGKFQRCAGDYWGRY